MIFISILLNFLNVIHILQGILRTEELLFESPPTQVLLCIFCNYLFHCPYIHIKWLFCITIFGYWLSRKFIAYVPPSQKFMSDMVVNRFINPSVQKKKRYRNATGVRGHLLWCAFTERCHGSNKSCEHQQDMAFKGQILKKLTQGCLSKEAISFKVDI